MQRWILPGLIVMILVMAGGGYAWWHKKQNSPDRVWVPLPLKEGMPEEAGAKLTESFLAALRQETVLNGIVKDLGLTQQFGVESEQAAAAELSRRIFVEIGQANPPSDLNPAINVGVAGKTGEHALLEKISLRLMEDVKPLLKQPQKP